MMIGWKSYVVGLISLMTSSVFLKAPSPFSSTQVDALSDPSTHTAAPVSAPPITAAPVTAPPVTGPPVAVAAKPQTQVVDFPPARIECQGHVLRDCTDHSGIQGEWVLHNNRTFASPVCCGWDEQSRPHNDPVQCVKQVPNYGNRYTGDATLHQQIGGRACSCQNFTDAYVWKAPGLVDFDPHQTCRQLGKRKVLLIGDSTMQQTASTLMNALLPGGCQTQILMIVSDTLTGRRFGAGFRGRTWNKLTRMEQPDIVILSTGAHVYTDQGYIDNIQDILANVTTIKQEFPNTHVVWKTQNPGGCSKDVRHGDDPARAARTLPFLGRKYQHDEFYDRDLYTISQMQQHGVPVLDMRMLYSRTDAHPSSQNAPFKGQDCLHLCSPGPLDVIAPLFQNLLMQLES